MPVSQFINHYRCPDDGTEWSIVWDCMCDDRCPNCNHEIVPHKSEDSPTPGELKSIGSSQQPLFRRIRGNERPGRDDARLPARCLPDHWPNGYFRTTYRPGVTNSNIPMLRKIWSCCLILGRTFLLPGCNALRSCSNS